MSTGKTSFSACYQPVVVTEWNRSGFCILVVILWFIELDMSKEGYLVDRSFFMCHSLFVNSHQLAPRVALLRMSPKEEEESPSSPFPGDDLHSWERQGLAESAELVHNTAGEHGKFCMALAESCHTALATVGGKEEVWRAREGLEHTRPGGHPLSG